eukprot:7202319-Heterocapsa_arctica.AAC.1
MGIPASRPLVILLVIASTGYHVQAGSLEVLILKLRSTQRIIHCMSPALASPLRLEISIAPHAS